MCCNVKPDTALISSEVATEGSMEEQLQDWDQEDEDDDDGEMQVLCKAQQHSGNREILATQYAHALFTQRCRGEGSERESAASSHHELEKEAK